MHTHEKQEILLKIDHRFNRIIGQLKAIQHTVREHPDTDCKDIIFQIKATRNALKKISHLLLEQKIKQCIDTNRTDMIPVKEALEILSKEY